MSFLHSFCPIFAEQAKIYIHVIKLIDKFFNCLNVESLITLNSQQKYLTLCRIPQAFGAFTYKINVFLKYLVNSPIRFIYCVRGVSCYGLIIGSYKDL